MSNSYTMKMELKINVNLKKIQYVGIVCDDNARLSPVATYLLRDLAIRSSHEWIRSLEFFSAGYKQVGKLSNGAKGFLQTRGFGNTDLYSPTRVDKYWVRKKDLIITMNRFLRLNLIHDYPITGVNMQEKIIPFPKISGLSEMVHDPGDDDPEELEKSFLLIEKGCKAIIKKFEAL